MRCWRDVDPVRAREPEMYIRGIVHGIEERTEGIVEAQRDRGAPENGDLRVRRGCGWLVGFLPMASSSSLSPHRYIRRQHDAPALVPTGPPSHIYGPSTWHLHYSAPTRI